MKSTLRQIRKIPKLAPRDAEAHKGSFGRVLIIGGSRGMIGAPALAANAALRGGAGLVTVACPASIQQAVATLCPCATSIPLPETSNGLIATRKSEDLLRKLGQLDPNTGPTSVAIGPGLGQSTLAHSRDVVALCRAFSEGAGIPAVIDADGLNAIAAVLHADEANKRLTLANTVLTPHPGEMARLLDSGTTAVQQARSNAAVRLAKSLANPASKAPAKPIVALKGHATIVTDGADIYTNKTGNPGMATGGSGDVLTGLIAALLAQGLSRLNAAILAVHVHGLSGDLAAKQLGQVSLMTTDLVDFLPAAFQQAAKRR